MKQPEEKELIEFSKDVRIHFRCTNYKKRKIKARARKLGLSVSRYIMNLISNDMEKGRGDEL